MANDPWALLREAREYVESAADDGISPGEGWAILARIDAALAEQQDSAKDVVESEVEWNNHNAQFSTAYPDDETSLTVCRFDLTQQQWRWDMNREVKKRGYCATEADAKSAAIAAARGMK
jgi:hypothetical protein